MACQVTANLPTAQGFLLEGISNYLIIFSHFSLKKTTILDDDSMFALNLGWMFVVALLGVDFFLPRQSWKVGSNISEFPALFWTIHPRSGVEFLLVEY